MSPKSRTRKRPSSAPRQHVPGHPAARATEVQGGRRTRPSRPMSVAIVAVVAVLAAVYQAIFAIRVLVVVARPGTVHGLTWHVSDATWVIAAILAGILAVGYLWVARGLMARRRQARTTMLVLTGINIAFGLLELPYGAFALILSAASFFLLITFPVKDWFGIPRK